MHVMTNYAITMETTELLFMINDFSLPDVVSMTALSVPTA